MNKEVCWGVGGGQGSCGKRCGGRCRKVCWSVGEVRKDVWGGCGKVYEVSGEVCWRVGKGCGEGNGEDVGKCVEVWGPNTLLIPHISLPSHFPAIPLTSTTSHHTFLHLLSYLFPHPSFLPPHPSKFSYYPHISLHLLKVWQSYHVTKFLWRSYWQPLLSKLSTGYDCVPKPGSQTLLLLCSKRVKMQLVIEGTMYGTYGTICKVCF